MDGTSASPWTDCTVRGCPASGEGEVGAGVGGGRNSGATEGPGRGSEADDREPLCEDGETDVLLEARAATDQREGTGLQGDPPGPLKGGHWRRQQGPGEPDSGNKEATDDEDLDGPRGVVPVHRVGGQQRPSALDSCGRVEHSGAARAPG